jgi:hypothetical protein
MFIWAIANAYAKGREASVVELSDSLNGEIPDAVRTGQLLTRNATTGWRDWLQGALWLFPEGLLRVPIGPLKALLLMGYIPVGAAHMREFSAGEFASMIANPHNLWIPANQIENMRLGHTVLADQLRVTLRNQRSIRLLWVPSRRIFKILGAQIREWGLTPN